MLITGYQADNTLGRRLVNGMKSVSDLRYTSTEVRAEIESLDELEPDTADAGELINWMKPLIGTPRTLKRVFYWSTESRRNPARWLN